MRQIHWTFHRTVEPWSTNTLAGCTWNKDARAGRPSGQLASGLFGATLSDRNGREKRVHNVNMRGRGRAFGRNTTVVGPSEEEEEEERL